MKKHLWLICLIAISVVVIVAIPFVINWLIIEINTSGNTSNLDWVNFLGNYTGAILGALISLIGIAITIRYTNEQNKKDRELQIRPYCSIRYVHDSKLVGTKKLLAETVIGCEPQDNDGPEYVSILYIKNIGLGPAIEFEITLDKIDDGREHYLALMQRNADAMNRMANLLQPGEEAAFPIHIYFNFDPIKEEDIVDMGVQEEGFLPYSIKPEVMHKYKNFSIGINIKYSDMYQNQYFQKVSLKSSMYVSIDKNEKKAQHKCDIHLEQITAPERV